MKHVARILTLVVALAPAIPVVRAQTVSPTPVQFGQNILLSGGQPASQQQVEPTIAANPTNPKTLVVGYFGRTAPHSTTPCFFTSSSDGGLTWTPGGTAPLRTSANFCVDPSLAADANGTFYYAYLDLNVDAQGSFTTADIRVARSTDGGRSFPESTLVVEGGATFGTPDPDKDYLAIDTNPKSRFRGTIYLSYTDFPTFDKMIKVTTSRDGGRTWTDPVIISRLVNDFSEEGVHDSLPVVAPDGTAFVFYQDFSHQTHLTSIKVVKSKDGGRTWSAPADVAAGLPSPGVFWLDNGDPKFDTEAFAGIFAASYPTAAVAPNGAIYVAWTDFPEGSCFDLVDSFGSIENHCRNADVRMTISRDGGKSWSAPAKISDDGTPADQFFPWMATQPSGLVSLVWLDRRLDPRHIDADLFYTNTADGRTFLPNVRVSSESSKIDSTYLPGDYNNLAATSDGIVPVWNDARSNSVQIYAARGTTAP